MNNMLVRSPSISNMIAGCEAVLGSARCASWNHEGQWLLDGDVRKAVSSGSMCPVTNVEESVKNSVISQWSTLWDLNNDILLEKSPQSLMKMAMLRQIFGAAKQLKFIVVIKNPVTLNIATPKDVGWRYVRVRNQRQPEEVSTLENGKTIDHFLNFMLHNKSSSLADLSAEDCSMGWLPAMEYLHKQLVDDTATSLSSVRIVRYEDFQNPLQLCKSIFAFVFESRASIEYNNSVLHVCDQYFSTKVLAATRIKNKLSSGATSLGPRNAATAPSGKERIIRTSIDKAAALRSTRTFSSNSGRKLLLSSTTVHDESNRRIISSARSSNKADTDTDIDIDSSQRGSRKLRLRTTNGDHLNVSEFVFIPDLVLKKGAGQIAQFAWARNKLSSSSAAEKKLKGVDLRLRKFGYSLTELLVGGSSSSFRSSDNSISSSTSAAGTDGVKSKINTRDKNSASSSSTINVFEPWILR